MRHPASSATGPGPGPQRRTTGSLTVGRRIAILALLPLLTLAAVFALFSISASRVGTELAHAATERNGLLEAKLFRDRIMAAERALVAFETRPSAATRDAVVSSRDAATEAARGVAVGAITATLPALLQDIDSVLAMQDRKGFDVRSGLTGGANAASAALETLLADLDYSDPVAVAIMDGFQKLRRAQLQYVLTPGAESRADVDGEVIKIGNAIAGTFFADARKAELMTGLKSYADGLKSLMEAIDALDAASDAAARHVRTLSEAADAVVLEASRNVDRTEDGLVAAQDGAVRLVAVATGVGVLLCGGLGWMIAKSISRPISRLAVTMHRMSGGDLDVPVSGAGRGDEIGAMARAIEGFRAAALTKLDLERETERERREAETERSARQGEREADIRQAEMTVSALGRALGQLSGGDLLSRIETRFDDRTDRLRLDFNAAAERLQQAMLTVSDNARTTRTRTVGISAATEELSRRTERQAVSLEEQAAAIDEITHAVKTATASARAALDMVAGTRQDGETGRKVVRQATDAMSAIERSSREIGTIISVVDEIAFQTNLLALNAGVEAARAGDAGRGFAVVASEVRALAQRSAEAAKQIKTLVMTSTEQVDRGVALVGDTGGALERMIERTAALGTSVSAIAAGTEDQARRLDSVNVAVAQMDRLTQENAAMVEETTTAAQALVDDTEELALLVDKFRTGASQDPGTGAAASRSRAA